jgi:pyruvate/2-oxoacid:ferredoxin oxidoreductase alpha subunit
VIAIYPITPASAMGEHADAWAADRKPNLWGDVPDVTEMQSEGGAVGAVHGALMTGALTTTFTASQGLLLMLPDLFKIAGELTPFCLHVAARALATHALSIFGDHSDVMAARATGMAMLCSGSVQEAQDLAAIAHATTLTARLPFLHFFDGFRTSHEVAKVAPLADDVLRALIDPAAIAAHRARALDPDRPSIRGTAQNPDVFFQSREAGEPFYAALPAALDGTMARFAELTGRRYRLFDYVGHPEAERVIVIMGSGGECVHETVEHLVARGEKVGVVKVRLFRPLSVEHLLAALPATATSVAVLDRTKEPGASGDPLLQEITTALVDAVASGARATLPRLIGGRYGLASKEFTPAMVLAVFAELAAAAPRRRFTLGIVDDVSHRSLPYDPALDVEPDDVFRAMFYGLGSDGTVSRQQEHDQDHRRGDRGRRLGLLRLRLEEGRRGHDLAPALWPGAPGCAVPDRRRRLHRLSSVRVRRALRSAGHRQAGRQGAPQLPAAAGRGVGRAAARVAGDRRRARCLELWVIDALAWPAPPAWAGASTPSCRCASSASPACCRATRRSPRSRRRSPRPTARRAPPWWPRTRTRSTPRWPRSIASRCRPRR